MFGIWNNPFHVMFYSDEATECLNITSLLSITRNHKDETWELFSCKIETADNQVQSQ